MHRTPSDTPAYSLTALTGAIAGSLALAPCYFELPATAAGSDPIWIQATPTGQFRARDGRPEDVPSWRIDASIAARVIADIRSHATPLVVDYEHQTLRAEENGQPAPAAGFIRDGEWREGSGLWILVDLTPRARQYLVDGEYRYFSPVFLYEEKTGAVRRLVMGALTNFPAIDGMTQMELRAAARFNITDSEDSLMKNLLLLAVCTALAIKFEGRPETDVEKDAIAALESLKTKPDPLVALRKELSLPESLTADGVIAVCKSLSDKATAAAAAGDGAPDPKKYVPIEAVNQLQGQVAALSTTVRGREIDDLVKPALEDGRLVQGMEDWARKLGGSDIAALRAYLDKAQPIAALAGSQTGGKAPVGKVDENGLTADELAVCTASNLDPKAFAATKASISAS